MTELAQADSIPKLQVKNLQAVLSQLTQIPEFETHHFFAAGLYCREVKQDADSIVIGKVHKKEHLLILLSGEVTVTGDRPSPERLRGPTIMVSPAGSKRAIYAHTEVRYCTVHRTDSSDIDEIEKELLESDNTALFDSENKLILDVPAFRALTSSIIAAEKPGFWSDWTEEQRQLYASGKWREFSVSRGYSEQEICDYAKWRELIRDASHKGVNPYLFIADLAAEAAARNLAMDSNGEILLSSHLPFELEGS